MKMKLSNQLLKEGTREALGSNNQWTVLSWDALGTLQPLSFHHLTQLELERGWMARLCHGPPLGMPWLIVPLSLPKRNVGAHPRWRANGGEASKTNMCPLHDGLIPGPIHSIESTSQLPTQCVPGPFRTSHKMAPGEEGIRRPDTTRWGKHQLGNDNAQWLGDFGQVGRAHSGRWVVPGNENTTKRKPERKPCVGVLGVVVVHGGVAAGVRGWDLAPKCPLCQWKFGIGSLVFSQEGLILPNLWGETCFSGLALGKIAKSGKRVFICKTFSLSLVMDVSLKCRVQYRILCFLSSKLPSKPGLRYFLHTVVWVKENSLVREYAHFFFPAGSRA